MGNKIRLNYMYTITNRKALIKVMNSTIWKKGCVKNYVHIACLITWLTIYTIQPSTTG